MTTVVYLSQIAYFSGCGTLPDVALPESIEIPIASDHPLVRAFGQTGLSSPAALIISNATHYFELVLRTEGQRISGTFASHRGGVHIETLHLFKNGVGITLMLGAEGRILEIRTSDGMRWVRTNTDHPSPVNEAISPYDPLAVNADLIEMARTLDSQISMSTPGGSANPVPHSTSPGDAGDAEISAVNLDNQFRLVEGFSFLAVLGVLASIINVTQLAVSGAHATALTNLLVIIGIIAVTLPRPPAELLVTSDTFQSRLVVAVDDRMEDIVLGPGESKAQMFNPCPVEIRLVELILTDAEGNVAGTVFADRTDANLVRDVNFVCGEQIEIQILSEVVQVIVVDSNSPTIQVEH